MTPTTAPMNLHPYLTPELLTLIRSAEPTEIEAKFGLGTKTSNPEWKRLNFGIDFNRGHSMTMYNYRQRHIKRICLSSGYGSDSIKRRVELSNENWRELFITRFNEILHACESQLVASKAKQDCHTQQERIVKARKNAVVPLLEPIPSPCRWYCENRYEKGITESLHIDTTGFTPEQIKQVVDLIRTFEA